MNADTPNFEPFVQAGYRFERELGHGGSHGTVFLAIRLDDGVRVAIKRMNLRADGISAFENERLLRFCRHPHVVGYLGTFELSRQDGQFDQCLVLEYVAGSDLASWLRNHGPLPAGRALRHFADLADALQHLADQRILHRDLKPANVLLTPTEQCKLFDFATAARFDSQGRCSDTTPYGTLEYLAPECALAGESFRGSVQSDLFSLAASLYECLTGQAVIVLPPGHDQGRCQNHAVWARTYSEAELDFEAPAFAERPELIPVLRQALASQPEQRYASFREFEEALSASLGQAQDIPAMPSTTPRLRFGAYQVIEEIAHSGSFAAVYVARRDTGKGPEVVLKVLRRELVTHPNVRRFRREAELLDKLAGCPDIVALVETFEVEAPGGRHYVHVLERLPGRSLEQVLARHPDGLPVDEVLRIMQHVARGLCQAHERGVWHNDVKPGNIICLPDGTAKLVDFGVSHETGYTRVTQTGKRGSLDYMAPEFALERDFVGSPQADIYSFGVMFYQALTGRLPWPSLVDTRGFYDRASSPERLVPDWSVDAFAEPELRALIEASLASRPGRRPAGFRDVVAALQRLEDRRSLPRVEGFAIRRNTEGALVAVRQADGRQFELRPLQAADEAAIVRRFLNTGMAEGEAAEWMVVDDGDVSFVGRACPEGGGRASACATLRQALHEWADQAGRELDQLKLVAGAFAALARFHGSGLLHGGLAENAFEVVDGRVRLPAPADLGAMGLADGQRQAAEVRQLCLLLAHWLLGSHTRGGMLCDSFASLPTADLDNPRLPPPEVDGRNLLTTIPQACRVLARVWHGLYDAAAAAQCFEALVDEIDNRKLFHRRTVGGDRRVDRPDSSIATFAGFSLELAGYHRRYEFLRIIEEGEGGCGVVGLGVRLSDGREFAIKFPSQALDRFVGEIKTLRKLADQGSHPHIVAYVENFQEIDPTYRETTRPRDFLVMELLHGVSLHPVVYRQALAEYPQARLVELFAHYASALAYCHAHDVCHRDLKPGNLFVEIIDHADGDLELVGKLLDFGIARDAKGTTTFVGGIPGTYEYMAPEQADPRRFGFDPATFRGNRASDVFSLGICLFEVIARDTPYPCRLPREAGTAGAASPEEALAQRVKFLVKHQRRPRWYRHDRLPALSALLDLLDEMLCVDPATRLASMEEVERRVRLVADALAETVSEPELTPPVELPPPPKTPFMPSSSEAISDPTAERQPLPVPKKKSQLPAKKAVSSPTIAKPRQPPDSPPDPAGETRIPREEVPAEPRARLVFPILRRWAAIFVALAIPIAGLYWFVHEPARLDAAIRLGDHLWCVLRDTAQSGPYYEFSKVLKAIRTDAPDGQRAAVKDLPVHWSRIRHLAAGRPHLEQQMQATGYAVDVLQRRIEQERKALGDQITRLKSISDLEAILPDADALWRTGQALAEMTGPAVDTSLDETFDALRNEFEQFDLTANAQENLNIVLDSVADLKAEDVRRFAEACRILVAAADGAWPTEWQKYLTAKLLPDSPPGKQEATTFLEKIDTNPANGQSRLEPFVNRWLKKSEEAIKNLDRTGYDDIAGPIMALNTGNGLRTVANAKSTLETTLAEEGKQKLKVSVAAWLKLENVTARPADLEWLCHAIPGFDQFGKDFDEVDRNKAWKDLKDNVTKGNLQAARNSVGILKNRLRIPVSLAHNLVYAQEDSPYDGTRTNNMYDMEFYCSKIVTELEQKLNRLADLLAHKTDDDLLSQVEKWVDVNGYIRKCDGTFKNIWQGRKEMLADQLKQAPRPPHLFDNCHGWYAGLDEVIEAEAKIHLERLHEAVSDTNQDSPEPFNQVVSELAPYPPKAREHNDFEPLFKKVDGGLLKFAQRIMNRTDNLEGRKERLHKLAARKDAWPAAIREELSAELDRQQGRMLLALPSADGWEIWLGNEKKDAAVVVEITGATTIEFRRIDSNYVDKRTIAFDGGTGMTLAPPAPPAPIPLAWEWQENALEWLKKVDLTVEVRRGKNDEHNNNKWRRLPWYSSNQTFTVPDCRGIADPFEPGAILTIQAKHGGLEKFKTEVFEVPEAANAVAVIRIGSNYAKPRKMQVSVDGSSEGVEYKMEFAGEGNWHDEEEVNPGRKYVLRATKEGYKTQEYTFTPEVGIPADGSDTVPPFELKLAPFQRLRKVTVRLIPEAKQISAVSLDTLSIVITPTNATHAKSITILRVELGEGLEKGLELLPGKYNFTTKYSNAGIWKERSDEFEIDSKSDSPPQQITLAPKMPQESEQIIITWRDEVDDMILASLARIIPRVGKYPINLPDLPTARHWVEDVLGSGWLEWWEIWNEAGQELPKTDRLEELKKKNSSNDLVLRCDYALKHLALAVDGNLPNNAYQMAKERWTLATANPGSLNEILQQHWHRMFALIAIQESQIVQLSLDDYETVRAALKERRSSLNNIKETDDYIRNNFQK